MKKTLFYFFLFFFSFESNAQLSMQLLFENAQDSVFFFKNTLDFPQKVADSTFLEPLLRGYLRSLHKQAYLEASFDDLEKRDSSLVVKFHLGKKYNWAGLRNGNVQPAFLTQVGYRERLFENKPFSYNEIFDIQEKLLNYAEDNGYAFAQVWLDSIKIDTNSISATLMMKTGEVFRFDTINTEGFVKISPQFLQNYLDVKKGELFSRSKILKVSSRLAELPYLSMRKKPTVTFREDRTAIINLLLDNKKSSRWDALIGVLPNTNSSGGQEFTVTYNFNADLQNLVGLGERIFLNLEQLRPESPRVNLKLTYPYILNFPFGFDGSFDLYKRDSTYIETYSNAGVQYLLGGNDYIKVYWSRYNANNLIINKLQIAANKLLPANLDVSTNTFGLEFSKQKLDYRFNPRRGWTILLRGGAGTREVNKNSDILNLKDPNDANYNFSSLYDTVTLKSFQYTFDSKLEYYVPFLKRAAIKFGVTSGLKFASAPFAQNEQYRIGGNKLLRGFNEEAVFATRYVVGILECRYLLGRNSFAYLFSDFGYVENVTRTANNTDTPLGFGLGVTFETAVGLFGVSAAVGQQQGNSIDLRNVKVHFGYVSLF